MDWRAELTSLVKLAHAAGAGAALAIAMQLETGQPWTWGLLWRIALNAAIVRVAGVVVKALGPAPTS